MSLKELQKKNFSIKQNQTKCVGDIYEKFLNYYGMAIQPIS